MSTALQCDSRALLEVTECCLLDPVESLSSVLVGFYLRHVA
ncbi:hypothetical protein [Natrinema zhouii]|nr:hypothetical protein [Natrinema zhouii]